MLENQYNWILDPLDGSYNYYRNIPIYCISLSLWYGIKPVLGVIFDLNQQDIYHGIIGEDAYKNDSKISVSKTKKRSDSVLATGFPVNFSYTDSNIESFLDKIKNFKKIRLIGSAAMSLAYLACGKFDAYHEKDIMIWDVSAGIAIVESAGGEVKFKKGRLKNSLYVEATNSCLTIN